MLISLITTCYNRASTLEHTIQSVLAQSYQEVEYIVVDGASSDSSMEIIDRYADRMAQVVSESDSCMYEAINKGIRLSTGEIIGVMHSDDEFYSTEILSRIAAVFEQTQADIVYANGIFVHADKPEKIVRRWISGSYKKEKVKYGWLPLHTTVYVRRSVFERCGLYEESYKIAADSDMLIRMLSVHHFKVHYMNEYVVKMRMGGISTSFASQLSKWREDIRVFRSYRFNPYLALIGKILSKAPQFL